MDSKEESVYSTLALREHEYYCSIWKLVKSGRLEELEGRHRILGQLMLEHPDYQYIWEIPYSFAETQLEEAYENEEANPDFHLTIEAIIIEQIQDKTYPEFNKAYRALLDIGKQPHEARHVMGRVFTEMIYDGLKMAEEGKPADPDFYLKRIRRLAKHPLKVLKQQMKKNKEGQSMKIPSDEELKKQITECDKAFHKAFALPNKTIVEVLIQGAELVNALGAKAILLFGELPLSPEKDVVYEEEVEARAAIATFREACNQVLSRFDIILESLDKLKG